MAASGVNVYQQWANFIVGLDDTVYYAIRCSNGTVLISGAVYATVYAAAVAALPSGNGVIIDKSGQQTPNPKICRYASSVLTDIVNSGNSVGTGAQQTISHGLNATPTRVILWNVSNGANPYQSATVDATNIYITAATGLQYGWEAKVV